jgi:hypothetical protein
MADGGRCVERKTIVRAAQPARANALLNLRSGASLRSSGRVFHVSAPARRHGKPQWHRNIGDRKENDPFHVPTLPRERRNSPARHPGCSSVVLRILDRAQSMSI